LVKLPVITAVEIAPAPHGPLQRLTHLLHPHHVIRNGTRPTRILQSDPISSSCSRSIEVFPELRQCCGTYDCSAPSLINAALIAKADFNFA